MKKAIKRVKVKINTKQGWAVVAVNDCVQKVVLF